MGYETAEATVLLETSCVCCGRPLLDTLSVECGVGPVCREKHGYNIDAAPGAREEGNRLVCEAALSTTTADRVVEIAARIRELGFDVLSAKIMTRFLHRATPEVAARHGGASALGVSLEIRRMGADRCLVVAPYIKGVTKPANAALKSALSEAGYRAKAEWERGTGRGGRDKFLGWSFPRPASPVVWAWMVEWYAGCALETPKGKSVVPDSLPAEDQAAETTVRYAGRVELSAEGDVFVLYSEYNPDLVAAIKSLPRVGHFGRKWDGARRAWVVALEHRGELAEISDRFSLEMPDSLRPAPEDRAAEKRAALEAEAEMYNNLKNSIALAEHVGARPYQVDGIRFLVCGTDASASTPSLAGFRLLADDMGLGKTWQALLALEPGARAVCVVPASVKYGWRGELEALRPDLRGVVLEGRKSWRWPREGEVVFVNFDILPDWASPAGKAWTAEVSSADREAASGVTLIVDEAQNVRNWKTKRAGKVRTLVSITDRTWFLTGTPVENRTKDAWGILSAAGVSRDVFGSFDAFCDMVGAYHDGYGMVYPVGAENVTPEGAACLSKVMLRRTKEDVMTDLPSRTDRDVSVNGLSASLRRRLDVDWERWEADTDGLTDKFPTFEGMSTARRLLAESRIPAALELADSYEDAEEQVVFSSAHTAPLDALAAREGWAKIDGSVPPKVRNDIERRFRTGELAGVALSIRCAPGLNLQSAAHMVYVDQDWNPKTNRQCDDRIRRIGQEASTVTYTRLVSDHPLDRRVAELLSSKEEAIDALVDGEA